MRYSLMLLDADDTLFDYQKGIATALPVLYSHLGLTWDPDRDLTRFRTANAEVWSEMRQGHISYSDLKVERFRRLFEGQSMDFPAVCEAYLALLVESAYLVDGAEEVCRYLASRCTLAVVTNGLDFPARVQRSRALGQESGNHGR